MFFILFCKKESHNLTILLLNFQLLFCSFKTYIPLKAILSSCVCFGFGGGGAMRGCAAGRGMVFVLSVLTGYIIPHESVLNRVYNFAEVCPKQCA